MKKHLLLFCLLFSFGLSFAQTDKELTPEEKERRERNIQAGNPFKKFGYTPKIATLSKGKYLEWHDLDSIVRIGSYSFHVKKKEITGYNMDEDKNSESTLRPELTSRWLSPDPLAEEFPSWSPYNFVLNNPLRYTDPTGLAPEDIIILINRDGASDFGHMAVLIGDDKNGWTFISKDGRADSDGDGNKDGTMLTGGKSTQTIKPFNTLEEALGSEQLKNYDEGLRLETTTEQDAIAVEVATKSAKEDYHVLFNNYADTATKAVETAGYNGGYTTQQGKWVTHNVYPTTPNKRYDTMVKQNKQTDAVKKENKVTEIDLK